MARDLVNSLEVQTMCHAVLHKCKCSVSYQEQFEHGHLWFHSDAVGPARIFSLVS